MAITKDEIKKILLVAVFGYGGTALILFTAYRFIPSGLATTIHFSYPVFVILGSLFFFKEKANPMKILSVCFCMGGILLFYDGTSGGGGLGMGLALLSGITYAFYILYIEKSSLRSMGNLKLTFYLNVTAAALALLCSLLTNTFTMDMTVKGWTAMAVMAVVGSFAAVCLFQMGLALIDSQSAAILGTFEPITSVALGICILGEQLTLRTMIGCVLIITSVVLVTLFTKGKEEGL